MIDVHTWNERNRLSSGMRKGISRNIEGTGKDNGETVLPNDRYS